MYTSHHLIKPLGNMLSIPPLKVILQSKITIELSTTYLSTIKPKHSNNHHASIVKDLQSQENLSSIHGIIPR